MITNVLLYIIHTTMYTYTIDLYNNISAYIIYTQDYNLHTALLVYLHLSSTGCDNAALVEEVIYSVDELTIISFRTSNVGRRCRQFHD